MKYLRFLYQDEVAGAAIGPEAMKGSMDEMYACLDAQNQAGVPYLSEGLHPTSAAITVRVQNGRKVNRGQIVRKSGKGAWPQVEGCTGK